MTDTSAPHAEPAAHDSRHAARSALAGRSPAFDASVGLTAVGLAIWLLGAMRLDLSGLTDVGLISVIPWPMWIGAAAVVAAFVRTLSLHPSRTPVLLFETVALLVILFATAPIAEEVTSFHVTWRHAGIIDHIVRTGSVDPSIDAFFNWPGFFVLMAAIQEMVGLDSVVGIAAWAPVFYNTLYLAPLLLIFSWATRDRRVAWLAVWIFFLGNWVRQDYLAPQATAFFLHLALLAVLLRWFGRRDAPSGLPGAAGGRGTLSVVDRSAAQRMFVVVALTLLGWAIVFSHQLTPLVTVTSLLALAVLGNAHARGLASVLLVVVVAWDVFAAAPFMQGRGEELMRQIGKLELIAGSNVSGRVSGSPGHEIVVQARMVLTLVLWTVGGVGWLRSWRRGEPNWTLAVLGAVPLLMLPVMSYGGELLIRVFLFTLPFTAFFVARALLAGARQPMRVRAALPTFVVCAALVGGFMITRYGNQRMEAFVPAEVTAVEALYDAADPGATLISATSSLPWKGQGYDDYDHVALDEGSLDAGLAAVFDGAVAAAEGPEVLLIVTRSQRIHAEMFGLFPPEQLQQLEQDLVASARADRIFDNSAASVYRLTGGAHDG